VDSSCWQKIAAAHPPVARRGASQTRLPNAAETSIPRFAQPFLNAGVLLNETEPSAKVSKVMTKNSNPMPSQLIQSGIVVEGYTSTCSEVNFVIEMNYKRLPKFVSKRCKEM
jgi:hypothetical protein